MSLTLLEKTSASNGFGAIFGSVRGSGHLAIVSNRALLLDEDSLGLPRREKLVKRLVDEISSGAFASTLSLLNDTEHAGDAFAPFPSDIRAMLLDIITRHNKKRVENVVVAIDSMWETICTPEMTGLKGEFQEIVLSQISKKDLVRLSRLLREGRCSRDIDTELPYLTFTEMERQAQHLDFTSELYFYREAAGDFLDIHGAKVLKDFGMDRLLDENDRWEDNAQWHDIAEKHWEAVGAVGMSTQAGRPISIKREDTIEQIKFWFGCEDA